MTTQNKVEKKVTLRPNCKEENKWNDFLFNMAKNKVPKEKKWI